MNQPPVPTTSARRFAQGGRVLPDVCAHAQVGRADAHPCPVGNGLLGREEKAEERGTQPEVFAA